MKLIKPFDTVSEHDAIYQNENLHPMVSVLEFTGKKPGVEASRMNFGFYAVYQKDIVCGDMKYGKHTYDYQSKALVLVAPGQVINVNINDEYKPQGYALLFHPDLIRGTSPGKHIDDYTFFSYQSREALHLFEKEKKCAGLFCENKI
mgnify:CR=1 FL=1